MTRLSWILALTVGCVGGEVSDLQATVDSQAATIAALSDQVADLSDRLAAAETTVQAHTTAVAGLEQDVGTLTGGHTDHESRLTVVETLAAQSALDIQAAANDVTSLEGRMDTVESGLLDIAEVGDVLDYLSADTSTDSVYFTGANVFVQSGSGDTLNTTGFVPLGNLILGYDEDDGTDTKLGSHCLIIGPYHNYSSVGCFIGGADNSVTGTLGSVLGGYRNSASGDGSTVYGGEYQSATFTNDYAP